MKRRLPFLILLGIGFVLWRSGFGFLASERQLTWRFPVQYGAIRKLELQVWDADALLKREEQTLPAGLTAEPTTRVPLKRGPHRAVASLWLEGTPAPQNFQADFDPEAKESLVLSMSPVKKP